MDTVQREKAPSMRWLLNVATALAIALLWATIVFDLCTGRRTFRFLDGLFLFAGPILIWQSCWRILAAWKARRIQA